MLRRGLAGVAGIGGAAAAYKYATDEGFGRACTLYGRLGPVVVHYRAVEFKHSLLAPSQAAATAEWRELDRRYAAEAVRVLERLQGMYTKYGQIGAGMTNTFSPIWIEELRRLEDAVPPRSTETVLQTIEQETGKPLSATFSAFDPNPLGSASIGQVHRATLASDGSEVAVKVQYPDAAGFFRSDMATIKGFLALAAPEQLITLSELERQFELEFDYRQEAANLAEVGANMRRHGLSPREVVVPAPRLELCSERVLVMELLPGAKLLDGLRKYAAKIAAKEGKSVEDFEAVMRAKIESEGVPPRYDGPSARQIAWYLALARLGDALANVPVLAYNASLGWLLGKALYVETTLPPNAPRIMDTLMRVHGKQLLVDGVFNADTHAGNFLLMPDDRIALIDYGATKRLTREERLSACCLYAALGRADHDRIADLAIAGGYKSKHMDREVIVKLLRFGNDTMGRDLLGDKNVAQFIDELKAADPYEEAADNLVMSAFMSFRLRIVGLALNHPVVCSHWWASIAEAELRREGLPYEMWDLAFMRKLNEGRVRVATTRY